MGGKEGSKGTKLKIGAGKGGREKRGVAHLKIYGSGQWDRGSQMRGGQRGRGGSQIVTESVQSYIVYNRVGGIRPLEPRGCLDLKGTKETPGGHQSQLGGRNPTKKDADSLNTCLAIRKK